MKVWDTERHAWTLSLAGHTMAVECVKWGGQNLLYSASQDRTIRVWETNTVSEKMGVTLACCCCLPRTLCLCLLPFVLRCILYSLAVSLSHTHTLSPSRLLPLVALPSSL